MAGKTGSNNRRPATSRPSGAGPRTGSRRPTGTGRSAVQIRSGKRRPSDLRRPAPRRRKRTPALSPFASPAFWLIVCIAVIVLILVFRGCGEEEDVEKPVATVASTASSSTIIGNTAATAPSAEGNGAQSGEPSESAPTPSQSESKPSGGNTQDEPDPPAGGEPDGGRPDDSRYNTFVVNPGIYLIGSDVHAGIADIDVYSGTGSLYVTDGSLNLSNAGNVEGYTSSLAGVSLGQGQYLTVSGNLSIKLTYQTKYEKGSSPSLVMGEDSYTLADMGGGTRYTVMSEGGDLKPGIYMIEVWEGNGCVYVPDRDRNTQLDFMVGTDGGYVDSVNYVKLKEGDTVSVEGCTVTFIQMKEG